MELPQVLLHTTEVIEDLPVLKFDHLVHQPLQEVTVVAHDQHRAVVIGYRLLQHTLGGYVEVVGRLVEDEEVGGGEKELDHREAPLLPTAKHFHLLIGGLAPKHECSQYVVDP